MWPNLCMWQDYSAVKNGCHNEAKGELWLVWGEIATVLKCHLPPTKHLHVNPHSASNGKECLNPLFEQIFV